MKKVVLLLSSAVLALSSFAQKDDKTLTFGVKAGLNMASISGTGSSDAESIIGFNVGGFANYKLSDNLSLQPELFYSAEGAKSKSASVTTNLGFINLPVLVKYSFGESKFSAFAGPQLGFLLSAKAGDTDIKDMINGTNFSGVFGTGYQFTSNLGVNLRYQLGLSNLSKVDGFESKSNVFGISVGYSF